MIEPQRPIKNNTRRNLHSVDVEDSNGQEMLNALLELRTKGVDLSTVSLDVECGGESWVDSVSLEYYSKETEEEFEGRIASYLSSLVRYRKWCKSNIAGTQATLDNMKLEAAKLDS